MPFVWNILLITAIVGLPLLLLVWGGSLLYRAFDGDRFTVRGKVQGRWVNRVSRRLLALGLVSILMGSGLCLVVMLAAAEGGHTLWLIASAAMLTLAIVVISWSWAGRRSAGKERCPRCMYDVSAVDSLTCPECGFVAETPAMWHKPRKRKRGIVAGGLLTVLAVAMIALPFVGYGWRNLVPTSVLISGVGWLPDSFTGVVDNEEYWDRSTGSLIERIARGDLTRTQIQKLVTRTQTEIAGARSADTLMWWIGLAESLPLPVQPSFTDTEATRLIETILLTEPAKARAYWLSISDRVNWADLANFDEATSKSYADQLATQVTQHPQSPLNPLRIRIGLLLQPDEESLNGSLKELLVDGSKGVEILFAALSFVNSLPRGQQATLMPTLWEAWLETDDRFYREWILDAIDRGNFRHDMLKPELRAAIAARLSETLGKALPQADEVEQSDQDWRRASLQNNLSVLVDTNRLAAVTAAIENDTLGREDLAIIAYARSQTTHPIPVASLVSLATHPDPLTRAVGCLGLDHALVDHRAQVRPFDDAILALEPESFNETLVRRVRDARRRENLPDGSTPPEP